MKIDYIRKLMTSHMVLEQRGELQEWEEEMIAHTTVEGVLFGESVGENGQNSLWYDITGKQALDVILESEELHYELLCRILTRIYEIVEGLESVLLQPDGLLLLPECIFVDYRTEQIFFCYYPGNMKAVSEAFAELMEYLLARLDHRDERVVALAYGVYERTSKGEGSLRELKELLCMPYEQDETEETAESVEDAPENVEDALENKQTSAVLSEKIRKEEMMSKKEEIAEDSSAEEKSCLHKNKAKRNKVSFMKNGMPEKYKFLEEKIMVWRKRLLDLSVFQKEKYLSDPKFMLGSRIKSVRERKTEEEVYVFEPEEEDEQQEMRPTVLLSSISKPPEGILRYEGKGACADLTITGASYVIGSGPGCEGYIPSTTVSRRHARITRMEDIYFIEDLNSSNGTYVGGEMLNYKTKMSLQKNEIVVFADEKFRFI